MLRFDALYICSIQKHYMITMSKEQSPVIRHARYRVFRQSVILADNMSGEYTMAKASDKLNINLGLNNDGLGVTLQALFGGMESLLQSKTVVGEPIEIGDTILIPLTEISAGLASGTLKNNAHNNGAGAMSARISPIAMIVLQGNKVRIVNVKDQDILTRLLDLIPETVERIKGGGISDKAKAQAEEILNDMDAENVGDIEVIDSEADK